MRSLALLGSDLAIACNALCGQVQRWKRDRSLDIDWTICYSFVRFSNYLL